MLQIKDLYYTIADRSLFAGINWLINPGDRTALIGPNGAGKTTLLRTIYGDIQADSGAISTPKDYQIGFLRQEEPASEMRAILDCVLEGNQEILDIEAEMQAIHVKLDETPANQETLLARLGSLQERFNLLDGYRLESEAKAILSGLGFKTEDFHRSLSDFSGGWRMRVHLARLLLQRPDLLLLDEPTNHLDIESLEWLEQYLRTFPGSIVLVSHDRFFIDRLAKDIQELDRAKLTHYAGNYHYYEKQKVLNLELLYKRYEEQKAERERLQRFVDRFRYKASKAAQVQSRVKMLEKMEKIELPPPDRQISFDIQVETSSYKDVLRIKDMAFRYETDWVLEGVDLNLYRGEKVALVGVNGAGKTTMTRLICEQLHPQRGNLTVGERVSIGYYAQHQVDTLDLDATIINEVAETAADTHRPRLRDILGIFQFSGEEPDKRIGVLSGGEKARVSLAKILLAPVNFLIMDEPTNHLDIASRNALEKALGRYDGTLLLISHDRYFLDKLVTRVIELKDGKLRLFEGNYSDYLSRREAATAPTEAEAENVVSEALPVEKSSKKFKSKEQKRREAEARQAISKERKKLEKAVEDCERSIATLEEKKASLETVLADPGTYQDGERAASLQKEYAEVKQSLETVFAEWEAAQLAYETLLEQLKDQ